MTTGLTPTAHHVALVLAAYADTHTGECFPSVATLAKVSRRGQSTVRQATKLLKDLGWLEVLERGHTGKSNRYRLTIPPKVGIENGATASHPATADEAPELVANEADEQFDYDAYLAMLEEKKRPTPESSLPEWKQRELHNKWLADEGLDPNGEPLTHW